MTSKKENRNVDTELLDNLPFGAALYALNRKEKELKVLHLNKRYWELVGRSPLSIGEITVLDAVYPDDKVVIAREVALAIRENRSTEMDVRILHGDGTYHPFHITGHITKDADGQYTVYAAYVPITAPDYSYQAMLPVALSTIMTASTDLIFVKDKYLRYVSASPAVVEAAGLASVDELRGKTDREVFSPEAAEIYSADDNGILDNGQPLIDKHETLPLTGSNEKRYIVTSKYPLWDAEGRVIGIYGIGRDVTKQREQESELKALTDNVPGGLASYEFVDGALHLRYCSEGFYRIFGYTRNSYTALTVKDPLARTYEPDKPIINEILHKQLARHDVGGVLECECRMYQSDGTLRWYSLKAQITETNEQHIIFNLILFDIHKAKSLEQQLSDEWSNLQNIMNAIPGGFCIFRVDETGAHRTYLSESAFETLGYSSGESAANDMLNQLGRVYPDDLPALRAAIQDTVQSRKSFNYNHRMIATDGSLRWVNLTANPVTVDGVLFYYGLYSDITERHEAALLLHQNEEKYRLQAEKYGLILNGMDGVVFEYDVLTRKTTVTDNFEQYFGYVLPEDWAMNLMDRAKEHPEFDYKALADARSSIELTGQPTEVTVRAETKSQGLRWFRITMSPILDGQKHLSTIFGLISDISESREEYRKMDLEVQRLLLAIRDFAPMIFSVNLSQNKYRMLNYDNYTTKAVPYEGAFDEMMRVGVPTIPESGRQAFIDAFSRENLLAAFKRGEKRVELEHQQVGDDGIIRWIRTTVIFVSNKYDDDVYEVTKSREITESKSYQVLLQKTYDLTLDNMPGFTGKWMFADNDVLLLEANQKYLDFMEISAEDALGKSIIYGFSEDQKRQVISMLYGLEKERKDIVFIHNACKYSGAECHLDVRASFLEERDGHSVYYGTLTDVTELVNAQKMLQDSNDKLRIAGIYKDIIDMVPFGGGLVHSLSYDEPFTVYYVSDGLLTSMGYTKEEYIDLLSNRGVDLVHPDDFARATEENTKHREVGDVFSVVFRYRHKDGHYLWVQQSCSILQLEDGTLVGASLFTDITKQKELEQSLYISEQEYRIAASLSNDSVWHYDVKKKNLTAINNNVETDRFPGGDENVPMGAIEKGYIAQQSADAVIKAFENIAQGEQHGTLNMAFVNSSDGELRWFNMSYSTIFDEQEKPISAVIALNDITEKKRAEDMFNIGKTMTEVSGNVKKMLVINVTRTVLEYESSGPHGYLVQHAETKDSIELLKSAIAGMVSPPDAARCAEFFDRERLLQAFDNGELEASFEYRGIDENGATRWMNAQTRMVKDDYTGDVKIYVLFSDIHEQKLAELELLRRAQTDSLTGLMNRESFEEEIQCRCSDPANRNNGLFNCIVMIDVDKFKQINDTLGHDAGDEALKAVAHQLKAGLRDDDVIARFGGDEFIALLFGLPSIKLIEERCKRINESLNIQLSDTLSITASIGIAICPEDGTDFPTLLKKADTAMYEAKQAGGNRCARYNADLIQIIGDNHSIALHRKRIIFARTFGYFDVFVNGEPINFTNIKEKELLAILIDRNGGTLGSSEAVSLLWEDEPAGDVQLARYRKVAMRLAQTLKEAGAEDIMITRKGVRHIDTSKLECDYYKALAGDPEFVKLFNGVYMSSYSWAEDTTATLLNLIK